jgi:hypothetical protein
MVVGELIEELRKYPNLATILITIDPMTDDTCLRVIPDDGTPDEGENIPVEP